MYWEKINNDLREAMREKKKVELETLRMLIAALKNKKIELKIKEDLSDEQVMAVVGSEIKKRKDSVSAYWEGNRPDLAERGEAEIKILEKYRESQMSSAEIEKRAKEILDAAGISGPQEMGRAMGLVMSELKGRADGNTVKEAVKNILSN